MVEENGANLEPEHKVARAFFKACKLQVPVDIKALVEQYADIEIDTIPGRVDAIVIRRDMRKSGTRPLIIMSDRFTPHHNRYRFTLAHELGHIIIPWQPGAAFCHAGVAYRASDFLLQKIEAEANRFASEILVPYDWVYQKIADTTQPLAHRVTTVASDANVSVEAAMLSAVRACPPDRMMILVDSNNSVLLAVYSPGSTFADIPQPGEIIYEGAIAATWGKLSSISKAHLRGRTVYAVDCADQKPLSGSPQPSTAILSQILDDVVTTAEEKQKLSQSINGIIGYANHSAKTARTPQEIAAKLRQSFIGRERLEPVVRHKLFVVFLDTKALELSLKR